MKVQAALCSLTIVVLSGCVTVPSSTDTTTSASYVGDRGRVAFDEIVVSLPFSGANGPYQNLHLVLAASVNPRKVTLSNPYEVEQILRRIEARVSARVSSQLSQLSQQSLATINQLREKARDEAQAVVEDTLRRWQHGGDYQIEVLVVNLYWTDASAGRAPSQQRGWW